MNKLVQEAQELSQRCREMAEKATPGPWTIWKYGGCNQSDPEPPEYYAETPNGHIVAADFYPGEGYDVEFVAQARTDVPALCDVIDRLVAEIGGKE